MNKLLFMDDAWYQYLDLHDDNRNLWVKTNRLIKECLRTPFDGTGKPEPLKGNLSDCWSRRISAEDRLIYQVKGDMLMIISCIGLYDDK